MEKSVCIKTFYPPYNETVMGVYCYRIWEGSATDAGTLMQLFLDGVVGNPEETARMLERIKKNIPFATNMFDCEFEKNNVLIGYEYAPEESPCTIISKEKLLDGIKQWIWAYGEDKNQIVLELPDDNSIRVYARDGKRKDVWGNDRGDEEW